jgi:hypothetical protein
MLEGRTQAQSDDAQVYTTGRGKATFGLLSSGGLAQENLICQMTISFFLIARRANLDVYASKLSVKKSF